MARKNSKKNKIPVDTIASGTPLDISVYQLL